ncbi:MAG: dTMP kinase [Hyphomonadaceae bacterium]
MQRGQFITLEGGEGSGKSTLQMALVEKLSALDASLIVTREPGGTPLGEAVRKLALHPPDGEAWTPMAETLLMYTAREDHLEKLIRPALERGDWVLCDRFADSTRAYQSAGGGVSKALVEALDKAVVGDTQPDLTFILDADPEALQTRRTARGETDAFEARGLEFHRLVRSAFLDIAKENPDRCAVIDALANPADVLEQTWRVIEERFELSGQDA